MTSPALQGVRALVFDVFGTVVDWTATVTTKISAYQVLDRSESLVFAQAWRQGYKERTRAIAEGKREGSLSIDVMHRQILEDLLASPKWSELAKVLDERERKELNNIWHRLDGWPDSSKGLYELKKKTIIATLSNGNVKLLVDMAKHADLPWDAVFAGELLGSYKPNPKMYLGAAKFLDLPTDEIAMVAAHIADLRAAASHGMKTVYVRRSTEDSESEKAEVKSKAEGGEVDVVVDSFIELAQLLP